MEGLDYEEDRRAENLGPDSERGEDGDDLLEDSQEKGDTQDAITQEEPHDQEARGMEDPDRGGRPGKESQDIQEPQPSALEIQEAWQPRLQDIGQEGQPEDPPGPLGEGQELKGRQAPRAQTDAGPSLH